jgi:hypothetical protein
MNSREKGKRGERQWRDELRANGYGARRGQQFSGSSDSPDVVCDGLPWIHFEVKAVERLNIEEAMEQARRDCRKKALEDARGETGQAAFRLGAASEEGEKVPVVAHRRRFRAWLVTMEAETFFRVLRGDFTGGHGGNEEGNGTNGTNGTNGQSPMGDSQFQISDFKGLYGPEKENKNNNEKAGQ